MSPSPAPHSSSSSSSQASLEHVRRLAHQLDTSIPLPGGFRVGWDAVLGLVPGIGDWAGALLSGYIILRAASLGASREVLLRMVGNVAVESVVGSVPLLGDLFDAGWRANVRNVQLLENHLAAPGNTRRASRAWVFGVVLMLVALLALSVVLAVFAVRALVSLVHSS